MNNTNTLYMVSLSADILEIKAKNDFNHIVFLFKDGSNFIPKITQMSYDAFGNKQEYYFSAKTDDEKLVILKVYVNSKSEAALLSDKEVIEQYLKTTDKESFYSSLQKTLTPYMFDYEGIVEKKNG